jgi:predicted ribosomally synthesized peptide with nif11-like leader
MSSESLKTFLARLQNDQGLRKELRAAGGDAGMPVEAVIAFAAGKGYEFRIEDIGELSDQQLDGVSGGTITGSTSVEDAVMMMFMQLSQDSRNDTKAMLQDMESTRARRNTLRSSETPTKKP